MNYNLRNSSIQRGGLVIKSMISLLIMAPFISSTALSVESPMKFCADLLRDAQKKSECPINEGFSDNWGVCVQKKDSFYHYLGLIDHWEYESPSLETQFNKCVRKKIEEISRRQEDKYFLKGLDN